MNILAFNPCWWIAFLSFMASFSPLCAQVVKVEAGSGKYEVSYGGKTIPVWYFLPNDARADTPILIVMHGVNRDADRYRDEWIPHASRYGFIVIAPEFSKEAFPGENSYNLGNTHDAENRLQPREQWSFSFLEPIFDAMKSATGNRSERYYLYGHSAGAQFVHRFLYFMPDARVIQAVAANAGWWTLPDHEIDFPYGLRGSGIDATELKSLLQRPLVVLLGTDDIDENHVNLRKTSEAMAQGPHRYARGQFYFETARHQAKALGVPLAWQLATAPGAGHHDREMAEFAVKILFGQAAFRHGI